MGRRSLWTPCYRRRLHCSDRYTKAAPSSSRRRQHRHLRHPRSHSRRCRSRPRRRSRSRGSGGRGSIRSRHSSRSRCTAPVQQGLFSLLLWKLLGSLLVLLVPLLAVAAVAARISLAHQARPSPRLDPCLVDMMSVLQRCLCRGRGFN